MQRRTPLALLALLVVGASPCARAVPNYAPGKIPVIIAAGEVTINGEPRPDLGRSFADTIAGGLLKTGSFTIIDSEIGKGDDTGATPPTAEATIASKNGGAHYAYIPRMIVESDFNRLTLKKVRVSDGEVVEIYNTTANSQNRSAMFDLLDETLKLVYSDIARDRSNRDKADAAVVNLDPEPVITIPHRSTSTMDVTPPEPVDPPPLPAKPKRKGRGVIEDDPPAPKLAAKKPAPKINSKAKPKPEPAPKKIDVEEAEEATEVAEYAGRLRAVNTDWHFCIIEVAKRGMLKVNDELLVHGSTSLEPLGKLRVSKIEGSQVVADALDVPLEMLRSGFKVYRWSKK